MIGVTVDKYEILEEIGQGGMATVYRAMDKKLKREVAIKILHSHLVRQEEAVDRFQREAFTVAKLQHPAIIEIYDYSGEESPYRYIVTELVEGVTLSRFIEEHGKLPCELVACVARELAEALDHAHRQGVVHRDLKPDNIMIRQDGQIKLMDFGIARVLEEAALTMTGTVLGSPAFMSPEQVTGKPLDERSDLFSLGSILYFMATAQSAFSGQNPHATLKRVAEVDYDPIQMANPAISDAFAAIIEKLLTRRPEERFNNAFEALAAFDTLLEEEELSDPSQELRSLFEKPEAYVGAFTNRMIASVEEKAFKAEQENTLKALKLYARLSALDPENKETDKAIKRLQNRQGTYVKIRYTLAFLVVAIAAVLISLSVWRFSQNAKPAKKPASAQKENATAESKPPGALDDASVTRERTPKPTEPKEPATDGVEENTPKRKPAPKRKSEQRGSVDTEKSERAKERAVAIRDTNKTPKPPKEENPPEELPKNFSGSLFVKTSPWADIYIDGKKRGNSLVDAMKPFKLSAGEHTIRLVNPGCEPVTERINILEPGQRVTLRKRLQVLPAYLRIVNSQGAMVFIDDDYRGRTPLKQAIEVRWDGLDSTKMILLSMSKEGLKTFTKRVKLEAGKTETMNVELEAR